MTLKALLGSSRSESAVLGATGISGELTRKTARQALAGASGSKTWGVWLVSAGPGEAGAPGGEGAPTLGDRPVLWQVGVSPSGV